MQKSDFGKRQVFTSKALVAARAILAFTILLTLLAGSIVLPATASGPQCTLACCAGRTPHAAGSCMHGSCGSGIATPKPAHNSPLQLHHHHEQQQISASDSTGPTGAFAGVIASAGGSDMEQVPTIEAAPYETPGDNGGRTDTSNSVRNRTSVTFISVGTISKPCQPDCGACASGSPASKRSRNATGLAGSNHTPPTSSALPAAGNQMMSHHRSAFGRQSVPRGPPLFLSLT